MLRKVFNVSYRWKAGARLLKTDGNRKVLGIFQTPELICLVLLYNSPSLLTEWVKQNLAEISTTYLSEMKLKVIFGNPLQSDIFPHLSWCKDWIILDSCMRGKIKCMWHTQWRGVTIVLDSSMLTVQLLFYQSYSSVWCTVAMLFLSCLFLTWICVGLNMKTYLMLWAVFIVTE